MPKLESIRDDTKAAAFLTLLCFELDKNPLGSRDNHLYEDQREAMALMVKQRILKADAIYYEELLRPVMTGCAS